MPQGPPARTVGARLRDAREKRGVSLRQIANSTRISVMSLEALERSDLSRLPGGIFTRSFIRAYAQEVGLDPDRTIISLLPGSREKEVHYHLPAQLEAVKELRISNFEFRISETSNSQFAIRNSQFLIPLASTVDRAQVDGILKTAGMLDDPGVKLVEQDTCNTLFHSSFAVVASGTATVEAALAGVPMVIIYRGSELNWRLIRPLIHLDTFGMVNLIAGRRIVPELLQHDVTGERIASEVAGLLTDPNRLSLMRIDLTEVRERLRSGGGSASGRAARAVINLISPPPQTIPGKYSSSPS